MSLAIVIPERDISVLLDEIARQAPDIDVQCWPKLHSPATVTMALVWRPQVATIESFTHLSALVSFGAGVDDLIELAIAADVPLARIVDPQLARQMARYVTAHVLYQQLQMGPLQQQQRRRLWATVAPTGGERVLILGAGQLGRAVADALRSLGFTVQLWARTSRADGAVISGQPALFRALAESHFLVNTLPLTAATRGILNADLFAHCLPGCYLVNVARGAHLVEEDLLAALAAGQLAGATLDVFSQEPLAQDHPFWRHPHIQVTPHCAAVTDQASVAEQVIANYRRICQGLPLLNAVDRQQGY